MSDLEEIKLEVKRGYYSRRFLNKNIILTITALIMVFFILIFNSTRSDIISPFILILLIISTVLLFIFTIYIGLANRTVIIDNKGIEFRFGVFNQKSLWKSLEIIIVNINPTIKKEQIVFKEKERSWPIVNMDFKEDCWNQLKELTFKYAEKNKITIES